MKRIVLLMGMAFQAFFMSQGYCEEFDYAHRRVENLKSPDSFQKRVQEIEKKLENAEVEFFFAPALPRIRFFKAPDKWKKDIRKLEAAAAILTEKYRKEIGAYLASDNSLWISQGSPNGSLVPVPALISESNDNQIFHTHPANSKGGATPSGQDTERLFYDDDQRASVISMDGFKRHFHIQDGRATESSQIVRLFLTPKSSRAPIDETNINGQAAIYDELIAIMEYFKTMPTPEIREKARKDVERLKRRMVGRQKYTHSSLPKDLNLEIENALSELKK